MWSGITILLLLLRKLKHREVKQLSQGVTHVVMVELELQPRQAGFQNSCVDLREYPRQSDGLDKKKKVIR